jgi:uncharacterized protein
MITRRKQQEEDDKTIRITFFRKNADTCPVCEHEFYREELLSKGGRLIAGKVTSELRRNWEENKKIGKIIPLIYPVMVCPNCYYASFPEDFSKLRDRVKERLVNTTEERLSLVNEFFPGIDFNSQRNIEHGICSYMLALHCYSYDEPRDAPTIKKGIASLRLAWLFGDMANHYDENKFTQLQKLFYRKAAKFYSDALEWSQNGKEPIDSNINLGPDFMDKNYAYDGMLYLTALLNYKVARDEQDLDKKGRAMVKVKRIMAKLYGGGKASKDKPTIILNLAKDYYDKIGKELKEVEAKLGYSVDT